LVKGSDELIAPLTCGGVPVKSAVSVSPAIVIVTRIGMAPGSMPSSSKVRERRVYYLLTDNG
jgi:hypothetical protein